MSNKPVSSIHQRTSLLYLSAVSGALFVAVIVLYVPATRVVEAPVSSVLGPATTAVVVAESTKPQTVYFTGDTMLGRHVEILLGRHGVSYLTASMTPLFTDAAAVVTNFESAMALPHVSTPSGGMQFSTKVENLAVLTTLGVTHASLANNHGRDYGQQGLDNTYRALAALPVFPFGDPVGVSTSSIAYIEVGDEVIALIGIHTLFREPTEAELARVIAQASASSTYQIAYIHWGNEYELTHSSAQRRVAEILVAKGIDAVVGHHPHVIQDIEMVNGVPVFYSLGNFIFDQYFSDDVEEGYVLGLTLTSSSAVFTLHPHRQCQLATPCPLTGAGATTLLTAIAERSDPGLYAGIVAQTLTFSR